MLILAIKLSILTLLLYACYTDLKWRHVGTKVSGPIAGLSLILFNNEFLLFKIAFTLFILISWEASLIGSADVIAIVPITFSLGMWQIFVFFVILCVSGALISLLKWILTRKINLKYEIPGYVPITIAFFTTTLFTVYF